jgi:hypothetical protein
MKQRVVKCNNGGNEEQDIVCSSPLLAFYISDVIPGNLVQQSEFCSLSIRTSLVCHFFFSSLLIGSYIDSMPVNGCKG